MSLLYALINASNGYSGMQITLGEEYKNLADEISYTLSQETSEFSMPDNGRIVYSGLTPISCLVSARFNLFQSGGVVLGSSIYKNGEQLEDSIVLDEVSPTIQSYKIDLAQNDYIELWGNVVGGDELLMLQSRLSISSWQLI